MTPPDMEPVEVTRRPHWASPRSGAVPILNPNPLGWSVADDGVVILWMPEGRSIQMRPEAFTEMAQSVLAALQTFKEATT